MRVHSVKVQASPSSCLPTAAAAFCETLKCVSSHLALPCSAACSHHRQLLPLSGVSVCISGLQALSNHAMLVVSKVTDVNGSAASSAASPAQFHIPSPCLPTSHESFTSTFHSCLCTACKSSRWATARLPARAAATVPGRCALWTWAPTVASELEN